MAQSERARMGKSYQYRAIDNATQGSRIALVVHSVAERRNPVGQRLECTAMHLRHTSKKSTVKKTHQVRERSIVLTLKTRIAHTVQLKSRSKKKHTAKIKCSKLATPAQMFTTHRKKKHCRQLVTIADHRNEDRSALIVQSSHECSAEKKPSHAVTQRMKSQMETSVTN
ncbi:hypothetical protein H6P81_017764 [Aristolochia fimbriata]|uniref:Uncharacterized protein n=1 Tax=Aristolochia fimbriata TaxID=158543 RepID=A0AAV7E127_ARIFI|nr:hypothetical protein H6P81_017764 [Aristolochia fimbriata]